jgi:hypothetical protein
MKITDKVKIGGYDYKVILDANLSRNKGFQGTQCANSLEIEIDSGLPIQNQESTLIHEIFEAINYHYELKLEHNIISTLESALYQVVKDNPDIFNN